MAERNAWVIERIDLGVQLVQDYDVLGADKSVPCPRHVVRYDFIPTLPHAKSFSARCEHDPTTKPEIMELDESLAVGQAIRAMLARP